MLLGLFAQQLQSLNFSGKIYITSPIATQDWKGAASLIVESFQEEHEKSLKWQYWEKPRRIQHEYKHYTSTARRMRGKKYAIILAKDSLSDDVVGICELGVSQIGENEFSPTIGVLAVHPVAQRKGIAQRLIARSEEIASSEAWGYNAVCGQILPRNIASIRAFEKAGYTRKKDQLVKVSIRRGFDNVEELHYIYQKNVSRQQDEMKPSLMGETE